MSGLGGGGWECTRSPIAKILFILKNHFKIHIDSIDTTFPLHDSLLHNDWYKALSMLVSLPAKNETLKNALTN